MEPKEGRLTFRAEGNNQQGSMYSSRVIHDPGIAGVAVEKAKKIAKGVKLSHCQAEKFVRDEKDNIGSITESQQLRLFEITYLKYLNDSIRFYNKYKSRESVSWQQLNIVLKDVFVDMKYQRRLRADMSRCLAGIKIEILLI